MQEYHLDRIAELSGDDQPLFETVPLVFPQTMSSLVAVRFLIQRSLHTLELQLPVDLYLEEFNINS